MPYIPSKLKEYCNAKRIALLETLCNDNNNEKAKYQLEMLNEIVNICESRNRY